MFILCTEEYGFAYQVWDYPGTIEELLQDWNQGKTPFTLPFIGGTPPTCLPKKEFKGKIEQISFDQYIEFQEMTGAHLRWCEDPNTLTIGEKVYLDPIAMPQGNETELSPHARQCPSEETMSIFYHGDSSPWIDSWVSHHINLCEKCQAKWIVSRESFNLCACSLCKEKRKE